MVSNYQIRHLHQTQTASKPLYKLQLLPDLLRSARSTYGNSDSGAAESWAYSKNSAIALSWFSSAPDCLKADNAAIAF